MRIAITKEQHDEIQKEIYRISLTRDELKGENAFQRYHLNLLIDELEEVLKNQEVEIRPEY